MDDNKEEVFRSTYNILTMERVFGALDVAIPTDTLKYIASHATVNSVYAKLLQLPMQNLLNGIILQQTQDYTIYIQKQFVDYFLSGESGKDRSASGADIRAELEEKKDLYQKTNDTLSNVKNAHNKAIANSRKKLKEIAGAYNAQLKKTASVLNYSNAELALHEASSRIDKYNDDNTDFLKLLCNYLKIKSVSEDMQQPINSFYQQLCDTSESLDAVLNEFSDTIQDVKNALLSLRQQFYDQIIAISEQVKLLDSVKIDEKQLLENQESLMFDKTLGDA